MNNEVFIPAQALAYAERANPHYSLDKKKREFLCKILEDTPIPQYSDIVELGVCHGGTALILTYLANVVGGFYTGVDNWSLEGDLTEVETLLEETFTNILHWDLIESSTHEPETLGMYKDESINLLFIDAGHDEANISMDCLLWLPKVARDGLVFFDDYPDTNDPKNCHWAVKHYADLHTKDWKLIGYYGGLLCKQKV